MPDCSPSSLGLFVSLVVLGSGPTPVLPSTPVAQERPAPTPPTNAEAAPPRADWIAERWPQVARVEAAIARGERDAARAEFAAWYDAGPQALFADLDPEQVLELAARLEAMATALGRGDVELAVRTIVVARLAELPTPDDPRRVSALERLATAYARVGDPATTLALFEEVHTLLATHRPADDEKLLRAKGNLAAALHTNGEYERAAELRADVVATYAANVEATDARLVRARGLLATALDFAGRTTDAREERRAVLAALEATVPLDEGKVLDARRLLATAHAACGAWHEALELHERVLARLEEVLRPGDPTLENARIDVGVALVRCGDLQRSGSLIADALAAIEALAPAQPALLRKARTARAGWCEARGELREALALESLVLDSLRVTPGVHPRELLRTESNLALLRWRSGDAQGAAAARRRILGECERLLPPGDPERLEAQSGLVVSLLDVGDLYGALELAERTLVELEQARPDDALAQLAARMNVAAARQTIGDFEGARAIREDVVARLERDFGPDQPQLQRARVGLASSLFMCGQLEAALQLRLQVVEHHARTLEPTNIDRLDATISLANSFAASGRLEEAKRLYEEQLAIAETTHAPGHRKLLQLQSNLGAVASALGDFERARELQTAVVHDATGIDAWHPTRLGALANLATTQFAAHDMEALRATAVELIGATRAFADGLAAQPPRVVRSAALDGLARLSNATLWDRHVAGADLASFADELFGAVEALRQVATTASVVDGRVARDPELAELVLEARWRAQDVAQRAQTPPTDASQLEAWRADLLERAQLRERCEGELRRALLECGGVRAAPSAASVAGALAPDALFVSFWRCGAARAEDVNLAPTAARDIVHAFVVEPDGDVTLIELGAASRIEALAATWRAALGRAVERGIEAAGTDEDVEQSAARALRAALIDPCLAVAGERALARVHVVLDDFLHLVPLDALSLAGDELLGERVRIVVESSAARLLAAPLADARPTASELGTLLAFGGIDYTAAAASAPTEAQAQRPDAEPTNEPASDAGLVATLRGRAGTPSNFAPLLSSRFEVKYVGALFEEAGAGEPILHLRDRANKRTLAELAPRARYLHVATHGWFAPESAAVSMLDAVGDGASEPLRASVDRAQETIVGFLPETLCGLALAGANHGPEGILTAEELATLDLTNCELAVLSACETNVGIRRAGQGIQSLQTALHAAGARTAITSLWRVDDAATRRLFELFYTKLWSENLGPADALWQAKMALRTEGHPTRDWAGWVLTGDPD